MSFKTSTSRRAAILPLLTRLYKETAAQSTTDELLFGSDFSAKLKEARTVDKISKEIKVNHAARFQPSTSRVNLNSRGPGARAPFAPVLGNQGQASQFRTRLTFKKPKAGQKGMQPSSSSARYQPYQRKGK